MEGVPTFLVLEDAPAEVHHRGPGARVPEPPDARRAAEGQALAELAEDVRERLAGARRPYDRPSLRDEDSLTVEVLAARHFEPPTAEGATSRGSSPGPRRARGGGSAAASAIASAFAAGRYVRAVNFHATPRRLAGRLEAQLAWIAERFVPVGEDDLLGLVDRGEWPHEKPGVVLGFFDGHRDNLEVAAPVMERLGLFGWFYLVPGWLGAPPQEHRRTAALFGIDLPPDPRDAPEDGSRLALAPEDVAALAERGHVIASHTLTHAHPADPDLASDGALEREVAGSRQLLVRLSGGRPVRALVWRLGSSYGIDARTDAAVRSAGYGLVFGNGAIQRVR